MRFNGFTGNVSRLGAVAAAALVFAGVVSHGTARASAEGASPDLRLGAAQFPDDDAIVLRWEQHWTLDGDGTVRRRDHKWLKLLNRRPIRRYADPRIAFASGLDELIIHKAQTILPGGAILPVPDYAFNIAGPDDVAGWPEYADWQDKIVSFSGIEPGVVLELDYEIVTPPGVLPWIEADLRLDDEYPVVERMVSVTVPADVTLHHQIDNDPGVKSEEKQFAVNGARTKTYIWTVSGLPGAREEPQSLPWQQRCPRLRFSSCPSVAAWVREMTERVDAAGKVDESIKKFAERAVEEELDPSERTGKLAKKIQDSFNFITSAKAMRSLACRGAPKVLRANYGNGLESAALLLAAVRSLGLNGSAIVGVDADAWNESDGIAPTAGAFAGVVVVVDLPGETLYVHPQHGVFENPGHWGRHRLLSLDGGAKLRTTYVYARGEKDPSELHVAGKIAVDKEGKATGELRVRLTGGFYDPAQLETADAQEKLVKDLIGRVLGNFEVTSHSIVMLSHETFKATANVASKDMLKSYGKKRVLKFGDGPALLSDFPLPLDRSSRRTDVRLAGQIRERVNLTIELAEEWQASITPASPPPVEGDWGHVSQKVDVDGQTVRFHRTIAITSDRITPGDFASLRDAINRLRTVDALLLVCGQ